VASLSAVGDDLAAMRRTYLGSRLRESDVPADPFELFRTWLAAAVTARLAEPNAMVLATANDSGRPSSRHVLLKELDETGFVFYTNLGSRKATEIAANPAVSLCFPWFAMARQVVVSGSAAQVSRAEAKAYWSTRPRESQIGAWASTQSSVIASRGELERRAAEMAERFPGNVPLPEFWGGYRVVPDVIEFWQGGPARLHDRLRFSRPSSAADWRIDRLAP
jgi:pyridoxamine 5'-phosphate oxidase